MADMEAIKLIISIVERGKGGALIKVYRSNQIYLHIQCNGRGTATSEIMDILGLGSTEKDVIISYASETSVDLLLHNLNNDLRKSVDTSGIVFSLPLTGINQLIAAALNYQPINGKKGSEAEAMKAPEEHSLILVVCNRGCSEAVMDTAKKNGARGGTVVKARWTGMETLEESYDLNLQSEREIIAIVIDAELRNNVMAALNEEHGLMKDSQAVISSLSIDQMVRL